MTGIEHSDRKGDMREAAATWFATMRGPDAETRRGAFEAWLARDPLHREAYSRIAEIFSLGKGLAGPAPQAQPAIVASSGSSLSRGHARHLLIAMVVLIMSLSSAAWVWDLPGSFLGAPSAPRPSKMAGLAIVTAEFATRHGQIAKIRLADGSTLTLDTDSKIAVAFDQATRHLRLRSGRARFDVAHEARPFIVSAGTGSVIAHGTVFDVALRSGGVVAVRLLRGMIDVAVPINISGTPLRRPLVERLSPGQQVVLAGRTLTAATPTSRPIDANWPTGELDCDRAQLATVAQAANRYGTVRIELAEPELGELRLSGTIRIDEPGRLADRLALLFDLRVDRSDPARVVLRAGPG
jgi:transmembrane sensor